MTLTTDELKELLGKDMSKEDFKSLIVHLKVLTEELGNGTLAKLKRNSEDCKDMCKIAGELNDSLGKQ